MNPSLRLACIAAAALLLLLRVAAAEEVATQVDIAYETFRLDNGLTVIVHSDHSTPTVFVGMWYAVGSKDEPEGKSGFAHLFEHLMFQGTANREGEYFSPFLDAGATGMNGTTSEDRTNYFATVPSGALDMALWMESDRMSYLLGAVTQDALDEQRGVVQNEKRQRENQPYAGMYDRIREGIYPVDHPYRHSIIGSMEDLDAATLEDVHEWFDRYYGASNVVLVLAGDVTLEQAKEKVAHFFGGAPSGEPLTYPQQWVPYLRHDRTEVMYDRVGQIRISRVWALPGLNERDTTLMYLVNETLVGNKNSPLRKKLVDDLKLATRVTGSAFGRVLSGEYHLTIDLREGVSPEEVLPVVDEVIAGYLEQGPDAQILENAKLAIKLLMIGALETTSSIGRILAEGYLYSDDPLFINTELDWLHAATADDVRSTANRWLTRGHYQLTVLPFPNYERKADAVDRTSIPDVSADSEIEFPPIETATLDNGLEIVVAERRGIPIVDITMRVATGATAAPKDAPGLADFVFLLLDKGTKRYDANELAAERDMIAMGGRFQAGLENSTFSYRVMTQYLGRSLELAEEMLRRPTFPDEELEKLKNRISGWLATLARAPSRAASSLFERAVYGPDGAMGAVWTPEYLAQVDRDKLAGFHRREIAPDNMTLYMIGDIDIDTAVAAAERAFGDWRAEHRSASRAIGAATAGGARVILVDQPDAESSTIVAGHAVPPFDASTSTELSILNRVFGGGFESRLNLNLREDKGWSYGYRSSIRSNASGDQLLAMSGQVQTDKTAAAMQEIRREFTDFTGDRPASDVEVERIKINRIRSLPGSFATNRGFLSSIVASDSYGLPFDYAEERGERIAAVSADGVARRAREEMDAERLTWVIVGDLAKIEDEVRALGYGTVEVWDAFGNRLR